MGRNFVLFWIGQFANFAASVVVGALLARHLGKAGLGVYVLVSTAGTTIPVLISFSLTHALLCHVGRDKSSLDRYAGAAVTYPLVWAAALNLAALGAWRWQLAGDLSGPVLIGGANLVAVQHFGLFALAVLMASEDFAALSMATVASSLLHILLVGLLWACHALTVERALAALCAAMAVKAVLMASAARLLQWPIRLELRPLRDLLGVGTRAHAHTVLQLLLESSGIFLLRAFKTDADVGLYSRARWLADVPLLAVRGASTVLWSRVAATPASGRQQVADTVKTLRLASVMVLAACLGIFAAGRQVLVLINGSQYADAYPIVLVLLPSLVGAAYWQVITSYFAGRGYNLFMIGAIAVALGVSIVLQVALTPRHGSWGTAVSSSLAYVFLGAAVTATFFREARRREPTDRPEYSDDLPATPTSEEWGEGRAEPPRGL
jgi:O-antigen/teichoic acid export membrane protein